MRDPKDGLRWLRALVEEGRAAEVKRLGERVEELQSALSKRISGSSEDALLSSKEIAPELGVTHHKTVERWVREKGLPCVRVGRNLRFRLGDVRRWVAQRKEG